MKSEEKLYFAIGEISEDIIAEASAPYSSPIKLKKALAVAASVTVVAVGITIVASQGFFNKAATGNAAPPPESSGDQMNGGMLDIREEDFGSLIYRGKVGESSYRFTLLIIEEPSEPIDVYLYSTDGKVIYTTSGEPLGDVEIRRPTVTVNGEAASSVPTEAGEYDITVSFDGLEDGEHTWSSLFRMGIFGDYHRFG